MLKLRVDTTDILPPHGHRPPEPEFPRDARRTLCHPSTHERATHPRHEYRMNPARSQVDIFRHVLHQHNKYLIINKLYRFIFVDVIFFDERGA